MSINENLWGQNKNLYFAYVYIRNKYIHLMAAKPGSIHGVAVDVQTYVKRQLV